MPFNLRWWYTGALAVVVWLISYYWWLLPEQKALADVRAERQQLSEQLSALQALAKQKNGEITSTTLAKAFASVHVDKMDFLSLLPVVAGRSGVILQSIQLRAAAVAKNGEINLRVVAEGSLEQLARVLVPRCSSRIQYLF